jgi:glucose-6-phosphate 1-dehydrogenase
VPFYLRTGKNMAETLSEIVIVFRSPPCLMFSLAPGEALTPNILSLCVQPDQGVHLRFEVKVPGQGINTRSVDMEFHYESEFKSQELPEAYERLLEDAMKGDPSLFTRGDFIEEAWRIVDPLLEDEEGRLASPPHIYEPGSRGPQAGDALLTQDGRSWARGCGAHGGERA